MNIIPIFYDFSNIFNEKMSTNINPLVTIHSLEKQSN